VDCGKGYDFPFLHGFVFIVGFDYFLPLSKLIRREEVANPHDLQLQLEVNGEVVQDDSTSKMLFKIPELISSIAKVMTLQRGDIVLSTLHRIEIWLTDSLAGTPKGVGELHPGDTVQARCLNAGQLLESFEFTTKVREYPDGTPY